MDKPFDFRGKKIIVTGATSDIGNEPAKIMSHLSAELILVSRQIDLLNKVKNGLSSDSHHVLVVIYQKLIRFGSLRAI